MDCFRYRAGTLHCEDVPAADLAARYGTPLYVYSRAAMLDHLAGLQKAFNPADPLVCYSLKSNPNIHIARLMGEHGAGFDVTSAGELHRALAAGGTGPKIVFAGVGKTDEELQLGLENEVVLFNVESEAELKALAQVARTMKRVATVALRVNPDLPPKTHAKTDTSVKGVKFGLDIVTVLDVSQSAVGNANVKISGLHMHLGSPIASAEPYRAGADKAIGLIAAMRKQGHAITHLNMGGGFGINYTTAAEMPIQPFADAILPAVEKAKCKLILEPGRHIVGNAGIMLSRVIYTKESGGRKFVIQDGGMNDLIRPTLYESFHRIWPATTVNGVPSPPVDWQGEIPGTEAVDVVGPVCETGDFLARQRQLPPMKRGDLLATFSAGAYGMAMSSNYNSRPRAAEVLVNGSTHTLIRRRETFDDLVRAEREV